jgi:hypothetical protein
MCSRLPAQPVVTATHPMRKRSRSAASPWTTIAVFISQHSAHAVRRTTLSGRSAARPTGATANRLSRRPRAPKPRFASLRRPDSPLRDRQGGLLHRVVLSTASPSNQTELAGYVGKMDQATQQAKAASADRHPRPGPAGQGALHWSPRTGRGRSGFGWGIRCISSFRSRVGRPKLPRHRQHLDRGEIALDGGHHSASAFAMWNLAPADAVSTGRPSSPRDFAESCRSGGSPNAPLVSLGKVGA